MLRHPKDVCLRPNSCTVNPLKDPRENRDHKIHAPLPESSHPSSTTCCALSDITLLICSSGHILLHQQREGFALREHTCRIATNPRLVKRCKCQSFHWICPLSVGNDRARQGRLLKCSGHSDGDQNVRYSFFCLTVFALQCYMVSNFAGLDEFLDKKLLQFVAISISGRVHTAAELS